MKKILLLICVGVALISCSKEELDLNEDLNAVNAVYEDCATFAGPDNSVDLTIAEVQAKYTSISQLRNLYNDLLGEGVSRNGIFTPSIEQVAAQYTASETKIGAYATTYTVTEGDCTDTAQITVNVVAECNVDAGADNTSTTLTLSQVQEKYNSISKLRNLYYNLIEDGVSTSGIFSPSIEELASRYVNAQDKTGAYSTTYTLSAGDCTDSAIISVTVVPDVSDPVCEVNAGPDKSITLTNAEIQARYYSLSRLRTLYGSLLGDGVSRAGSFSPSIEELAATYTDAEDKAGKYTTTYTLVEGNCSDTAEISVIVTD